MGEGRLRNGILHCIEAPPHKTFIKYKEGESITLSGETCRHQGSKLKAQATGQADIMHLPPDGFP